MLTWTNYRLCTKQLVKFMCLFELSVHYVVFKRRTSTIFCRARWKYAVSVIRYFRRFRELLFHYNSTMLFLNPLFCLRIKLITDYFAPERDSKRIHIVNSTYGITVTIANRKQTEYAQSFINGMPVLINAIHRIHYINNDCSKKEGYGQRG